MTVIKKEISRVDLSLILASSSPYRARLLQRLQVPFTAIAANVDENPLKDELPQALVQRLSESKAQLISQRHPDSWVIGSDQVAVCDGKIIGKPGNHENAVRQLTSFSNKTVEFMTGIAIAHHNKKILRFKQSSTFVVFKSLSFKVINSYLLKDKPYDCAGSFKVESLGILLFEKILSEDPTCLEGLPLITLCELMAQEGIDLLEQSRSTPPT